MMVNGNNQSFTTFQIMPPTDLQFVFLEAQREPSSDIREEIALADESRCYRPLPNLYCGTRLIGLNPDDLEREQI
jgi:hypothetical protein